MKRKFFALALVLLLALPLALAGCNDDKGERHELEFIYRRPSVADMEAFNKAVIKSSITAQSNLLASLIVHPAPADIVNELAPYPPVVAEFINENVTPFFGTAIVSRSSRI